VKLVNLIGGILCVFAFTYNANAMSFNRQKDFVNYRHTNMPNNTTVRGLSRDIQQLKKEMNLQMIRFHRCVQSFESNVFMQTISLRQHFWQLEMIVNNRLTRQLSTGNEKWDKLSWPQWTIGAERDEPLFSLHLNAQQMREEIHRQMKEFMKNIDQLSKRSSVCKDNTCNSRPFKLNYDVEQFNQAVDEHLSVLHNDVRRLETVVEDQIFDLRQDVDSLKSKIDVFGAKLQLSMIQGWLSAPDSQQSINSDIYNSLQTLLQYIRYLDTMSDKNIVRTRQEVSLLRTVIYEDVTLFHQCARSLQTNVCGEFSYKYDKFQQCRQ